MANGGRAGASATTGKRWERGHTLVGFLTHDKSSSAMIQMMPRVQSALGTDDAAGPLGHGGAIHGRQVPIRLYIGTKSGVA